MGRYIDLLEAARMLRRLQPMYLNLNKRLVKTPKTYLRDSGLLHALLGIQRIDDLMAHPVMGYSWEGFVLEHICQLAPRGAEVMFYRTAALGKRWILSSSTAAKTIRFEIKSSSARIL